jgi:hypothetical protein
MSTSTIWRWIRDDYLPSYRLGGRRVRVKRSDLEAKIVPWEPRRKGLATKEIDSYLTPMSDSAVDPDTAMATALAFQEKLLAGRGGRLFSSSADDINEAREERTADL